MSTLYIYRFGAAVFDESTQQLVVGGLVVDRVQHRPLQILSLLLARRGEVVSHDELFQTLWGGRGTAQEVISTAIMKLRNALGAEALVIENVPRRGYRFAGRFERSPVGPPPATALALAAGQPVPQREGFVLEALLATSGRRQVWVARNATGEQRVYKFASFPEDVSALKREAALSQVLRDELGGRPDLLTILGWSFDTAPCFIESEYGGEDLARWADRDGHLAKASPDERLGLLLQVADAVAAAHSASVLHKDLKPENILVSPREGGGWQVRVADFGSGRVLEPERLAHLPIVAPNITVNEGPGASALRGTLSYLAPEVLQGRPASPRSDLYSLGVILFQLLAGDLRTPFGEGWERSILDELLREDIASAVDSNPARRATGVQEWAAGLRRLAPRREERARQQAGERQAQLDREAARLARARRPWIIAAAIALCAGLAVTLYLYYRVRESQQALAVQYASAQALNTFLTDDFLAAADPTVAGSRNVTVIDAAHRAAAGIDTAFAASGPAVRGSVHAAMQRAFFDLGEFEASLAEGGRALADLAAARPQEPERVADVQIDIAVALATLSRRTEAAAHLDNAWALIARSHLTESAVAARYWDAHAGAALSRNVLPVGLAESRRAWELARRAPGVDAGTRDRIQLQYADALRMSAHFKEAGVEARELLARQSARLGAAHPRTCFTGVLVAMIEGYTNGPDQPNDHAIAQARDAARCLSEGLGPAHRWTIDAYSTLAGLQYEDGYYDEAARAYDQVAAGYTKLIGPAAKPTLTTRLNAAMSRQHAGQAGDAERELAALLEVARGALEPGSPTLQNIRYHLADCRLDLHRTDGVQPLLEGLSATVLKEAEIEPDWEGRLAYQQGRLALYTGDRTRAAALLGKAEEIVAARNPDGIISPAVIRALIDKARAPQAGAARH